MVHLVVNNNGKRVELSTGLHTSSVKSENDDVMRLAEILRSKKEVEIVSSANGIIHEGNRMTLYGWCEKCNRDLANSETLRKSLPYIKQFGGDEVLLTGVTYHWIETFVAAMKDRSGLGAWSAEKYSSMVRKCLKRAVMEGLIVRNPATGVPHITTPESDKEPLTANEVRAMVRTVYRSRGWQDRAFQDEIRKAFIFSCVTGLRIVDLKTIQWKKIDMERRLLGKVQQKTQRTVWVPLNQEAWRLLDDDAPHDPEALIFPLLSHSESNTNRYISAWAKAAGIKKHVTWHIGRYTDASLLLDAGADLYTVQKLLGHKKIQTTQTYAKPTDRAKRAAVDSLPTVLE